MTTKLQITIINFDYTVGVHFGNCTVLAADNTMT